MPTIVPTDENTLNVELEVDAQSQVSSAVDYSGLNATSSVAAVTSKVPTYEQYQTSQLSSSTPSIAKVAYTIGKKVLSIESTFLLT